MAGIFKAYDIRGIFGETLTEGTAYDIGRAFFTFLGCRKVVVGRDMRPHSAPLFDALARGLTEMGADVTDLGVVTTPMSYFANGTRGADAGIMITASHNPGPWNGFKLCRGNATPISGTTGIEEIEQIVKTCAYAEPPANPGAVSAYDVKPSYYDFVRSFADIQRPLRVVVDYANGMGICENIALDGLIEFDPLFDELDGTFPHHEANPLVPETYKDLQQKMATARYDFGIAYDGDADRVGFADETGAIIPMDMITALIATSILRQTPGAAIYYDLRSSWAVKEVIKENGGRPLMSRVGHAFIKAQMREENAVFGGELSGHYYFRENFFTESSSLAVLSVANLVSQSEVPISQLVAPIQRYHCSGEINSSVDDVGKVFATLRKQYASGREVTLDGLSIEFDDWWFNVRPSNTEPLVRLNLEAQTRDAMEQRRDEVLEVIRG